MYLSIHQALLYLRHFLMFGEFHLLEQSPSCTIVVGKCHLATFPASFAATVQSHDPGSTNTCPGLSIGHGGAGNYQNPYWKRSWLWWQLYQILKGSRRVVLGQHEGPASKIDRRQRKTGIQWSPPGSSSVAWIGHCSKQDSSKSWFYSSWWVSVSNYHPFNTSFLV